MLRMLRMLRIVSIVIMICVSRFSVETRHVHTEHIHPSILMRLPWMLERELGHVEKDDDVCHTHICKETAQSLLSSLDVTVDPCQDFYNFACGGWIAKHPVPPTENHWNQFDILDQELDAQVHQMLADDIEDEEEDVVKATKLTYQACMDVDKIERRGVQPLLDLLERFGGWPIISSSWAGSGFDWLKTIGQVINGLAITPIITIYVGVDRKNTTRNILVIDQPSLVLPRYMLVDPHQGHLQPYMNFIARSAHLLSRRKAFHIMSLHSSAFEIISFEMALARITKKDEDRRDANDTYNLLTISQLQKWTNRITPSSASNTFLWKVLMSAYLGEDGPQINDRTQIVVADMEFLKDLILLLHKTPRRIIANYVLWRVVKTLSRDVSSELSRLNFAFKSQLSAVKEDHPRWRECVLNAGYLTFAVGYMYTNKHFSDQSKAQALEMVSNIRSAFREELQEIQWMDDETRASGLKKADAMTHFIGYPNWYSNVTALANYYKGIRISKEHFQNKLNLRGFLVRKVVEKLYQKTDRSEWTTSPAIVNAYYNPELNSIIFPAGILQTPFFGKGRPDAINYGSIGAIIGHEITHGFDDMGRQSDEQGNIEQWWSQDTEDTYLKLSQCFIDQYNNFRIPELDKVLNTRVTMNGLVTLGENMADNGGVRSALRAYKTHVQHSGRKEVKLPGMENFTAEQMFYLGFANVWCESTTQESLMGEVLGDPHAPHRLRVVGTLSNIKEFAQAWKCPINSTMNPVTKCRLW